MIKVTATSELSQQRNGVIIYLTCSRISRHWELFSNIVHGSFFLQLPPPMFVKFELKSVIALLRYFGIEVSFFWLEMKWNWTILIFDRYLYKRENEVCEDVRTNKQMGKIPLQVEESHCLRKASPSTIIKKKTEKRTRPCNKKATVSL